MTSYSRSFAVLLVVALPLLICVGCDPRSEYREFFSLPDSRQAIALRARPPAEQVDIYLAGMKMHPPMIWLAGYVAYSGDDVVPEILRRLELADGDGTKEDLVYLLSVIACERSDLRWPDSVLVSASRKAVRSISAENIRGLSEEFHAETVECLRRRGDGNSPTP